MNIQMKWLNGSLMVRLDPSEPWKHYKQIPGHLQRPDNAWHFSPGFATMQHLLKQGAVYCQDTPNYDQD